MVIIIKNNGGEPIYEQIKNQIKEAILNGHISENEWLPSIRQLARDLKISVITTTKAYNELEKEGYLIAVQGKGYYVASKNNELIKEQFLKNFENNLIMAIDNGRKAGLKKEEMNEIFREFMEE